jgi:microcystin-dependent protein
MANYEETRYDFDGANLTDIEGVNTGIILPWSESSAPSGFLECNGSAVSRSTYAALFAVVSTTWGVGDGSTTFNVPDLADRCCVHTSPTKAFATTGGANSVAVTGNVTGSLGDTTISIPTLASHSHTVGVAGNVQSGFNPGSGGPGKNPGGNTGNAGGGSSHSHPFSAGFTGDSKSVLQPYLTVMYIIKT